MEKELNISGVSENLAESIAEHAEEQLTNTPVSFLHGRKIAISVSVSEELEYLGLSTNHLDDISIEIARYLIVNGAIMLYGGDLRQGGFTSLFAELSYQYKYLNDKERRFVNYFPFPNSNSLTIDDKANFVKQQVEPIILDVPLHLGEINRRKGYKPFADVSDRFVFSECFADMRVRMATDSNARIVLGGKQKGFLGYLPGIIEEAYHSLAAKKPIFILGGFGGAAKSLAQLILGGQPRELSNDFQYDSDFLKQFKEYCHGKSITPTDYDAISEFFQKHKIEYISELNGLSIDENKILFESTNIHEIVFLIIKGLKKIFSK
jgi:hypothetical protein